MARAYAASVRASSSVPTWSNPARPLLGSRRSAGRWRYASSSVTTPSGTLTRNIARQPNPEISAPPSDGPSAVPIADIVPSSPIAPPVLSFGTVSPTNAMVRAIMTAAPSPCAALAPISSQSVGATPHSTEATVNREIPASSSRRRPVMSPSRPTLTIEVVIARR